MSSQFQHPVLPRATHDEASRQEFVRSFKRNLFADVLPGNRLAYDGRVVPQFSRDHGRKPHNRHEIWRAMLNEPVYQMFSSLKRTQQEMMWAASGETTERCYETVRTAARKLTAGRTRGSLRLDPKVTIPRYNTLVDIHIQPGGYHGSDDLFAGALYDHAVYSYATGTLGPLNDDMGATVIAHLRRTRPDFSPRRILDMGCAAGHSTLPYVDAFPEAEVHAIDVAAAQLRYAHARAEGLGKRVHFVQQSAEATDFDDGFFDLIVSHILFHETSARAVPKILRETYRLLAPGGMAVHSEVPGFHKFRRDPFDQIGAYWEAHYNDEPFMPRLFEMDLVAEAEHAGFRRRNVQDLLAPSAYRTAMLRGDWYLLEARKS